MQQLQKELHLKYSWLPLFLFVLLFQLNEPLRRGATPQRTAAYNDYRARAWEILSHLREPRARVRASFCFHFWFLPDFLAACQAEGLLPDYPFKRPSFVHQRVSRYVQQ